MATETLPISQGIYRKAVEDTRGKDTNELAKKLDEQARRLEEMTTDIATDAKGISTEFVTVDEIAAATAESVDQVSAKERTQLEQTLNETGNKEGVKPEQLQGVAKDLKQASKDVGETLGEYGTRNVKKEGNTAGEAMLDQPNSDEGDAAKVMGDTSVVDRDAAAGLAAHEDFHTKAKLPDADQVEVAKGKTMDVTTFEEIGAMAVQEKVASKSIGGLSADYQEMHNTFGKMLPRDRIIELVQKGEMQQFGREARKAADPEFAMAA